MTEELDFSQWLSKTQERRDFLDRYGRTGEGSGQDMNKAIEYVHESEIYRDRAKDYLSLSRAQAMFKARREHEELTSREREIIEKDAIRHVQIIVDACETTLASCTKRYFTYGRR